MKSLEICVLFTFSHHCSRRVVNEKNYNRQRFGEMKGCFHTLLHDSVNFPLSQAKWIFHCGASTPAKARADCLAANGASTNVPTESRGQMQYLLQKTSELPSFPHGFQPVIKQLITEESNQKQASRFQNLKVSQNEISTISQEFHHHDRFVAF